MIKLKDNTPNREYWNIVKGLGILLVVVGHACTFSVEFVYIFHLQLFFFVSGYLYSEKKYGDHPVQYVKKRFVSLWLKYMILSAILVILHNPLYDMGMQRLDATRYSAGDILLNLVYCVIGNSKELLGGTLWFLPALFLVVVFLEIIICISRRLEKLTGHTVVKLVFQAVLILAMTYLGYRLIAAEYDFVADLQVVLAVMLYAWLGYIIRNYADISKMINLKITKIIAVVVMIIGFGYVYWYSTRHWVDLIFGSVTLSMYLPAIVGIVACLILSYIIKAIPVVGKFFEIMGKNSLIIMIVHYPVLKIIDKLICVYIGDSDGTIYDKIPISFPNIWPVYIIVSVGISLFVAFIINKIKATGVNKHASC